jgi:hypothetical protein
VLCTFDSCLRCLIMRHSAGASSTDHDLITVHTPQVVYATRRAGLLGQTPHSTYVQTLLHILAVTFPECQSWDAATWHNRMAVHPSTSCNWMHPDCKQHLADAHLDDCYTWC